MKSRKLLTYVLLIVLIINTVACTYSKTTTIKKDNKTSQETTETNDKDKKDDSDKEKDKEKKSGVDRNSDEAKEEQKKFNDFAHEEVIEYLSQSNFIAHLYVDDFTKYEELKDAPYIIENVDYDSFKENIDTVKESLNQLDDFNYDLLTDEQQKTYDVISEDIKVADDLIKSLDDSDEEKLKNFFYMKEFYTSQNSELLNIPVVLSKLGFMHKSDIDDYITNLEAIDGFCDEIIAFETEKYSKDYKIPQFSLDNFIEAVDDFTATGENTFLISSFDSRIDAVKTDLNLSDEDVKNYKEKNKSLITDTIFPAYKRVRDHAATLKGDSKIYSLLYPNNGDDYFEYLLKTNVGTDKSVEEIKELLEDSMDEAYKEIQNVYLFHPTIDKSFNVYDDYEPDQINDETDIRKTIDKILPLMPDYFPDVATTNYLINYFPDELNDSMAPAAYYIPPIDNYEKNYVYINLSSLQDSDTIVPTLAHETFPGHMFQITYFGNKSTDSLINLYSYDGYSEGWGLYAEYYISEMVGKSKAECKFNRANLTFTYCVYCLCDIGINYEGWTRDDVDDFFSKYFELSDEDIDDIVSFFAESPATYECYCLGFIDILTLKEKAKETLGDKYSEKEFHTFILDNGPTQLQILDKRFDEWLETY